ncbi:unnamed protein product [Heterobilharzia americana]|nr:unnamed protein product [Heterobilharzia americana]
MNEVLEGDNQKNPNVLDTSHLVLGPRPHSVEIMRNLDLDESFIDPFLQLAPFSARSEQPHDEGLSKEVNPRVAPSQMINNLPISINNLKAHLPFLATHLQEALVGSTTSKTPTQFAKIMDSIYSL